VGYQSSLQKPEQRRNILLQHLGLPLQSKEHPLADRSRQQTPRTTASTAYQATANRIYESRTLRGAWTPTHHARAQIQTIPQTLEQSEASHDEQGPGGGSKSRLIQCIEQFFDQFPKVGFWRSIGSRLANPPQHGASRFHSIEIGQDPQARTSDLGGYERQESARGSVTQHDVERMHGFEDSSVFWGGRSGSRGYGSQMTEGLGKKGNDEISLREGDRSHDQRLRSESRGPRGEGSDDFSLSG
jgi:hypothetical protein